MGMARYVPARDRAAGDGRVFEAPTARDCALQCARAGAGCGFSAASRILDLDSQFPGAVCRSVSLAAAGHGRAMELDRIDRRPDGYLLQPLRPPRSSLEIAPSRWGDNSRLRDGRDR